MNVFLALQMIKIVEKGVYLLYYYFIINLVNKYCLENFILEGVWIMMFKLEPDLAM